MNSLSVTATIPVNGRAAGTQLVSLFTEADYVWPLIVNPDGQQSEQGMLLVSVQDNRGNITEVERYFGKTASDDPEPDPEPKPKLCIRTLYGESLCR